MDQPLMPKATAVWLVDNTSLTFEQIADFCGLHQLEVKGIADGEVGAGIRGLDPVTAGQLDRSEIERCQQDPKLRMKMSRPAAADIKQPKRREARYTPLSKRQDRPDAIAWLLRNHRELTDQQVCKLLGTTRATVNAVRDRTHWKSAEIRPRDPVILGLCTQLDLDAAVISARAVQKEREALELGAAEAAQPSAQPPVGPDASPAEEDGLEGEQPRDVA